jgi:hypothetical protein
LIEAFPDGARQQSAGVIVKSGRLSAEGCPPLLPRGYGVGRALLLGAWCTGCVSIPGAAVYEPGGQKDDAGKLEFFCRIPLNFNSYFGMLLQEFKVFS